MVNSSQTAASARLDAIFHALSDPTRRSILRRISTQSRTVGEIADPYSMSLPAISKHLKVLERAELIVREKQGSFQVISINPGPMKQAHRWLSHYEQFWGERLDALASMFSEKRKSQ
jgi:DNA-binding transcriptional ArsR family regulator